MNSLNVKDSQDSYIFTVGWLWAMISLPPRALSTAPWATMSMPAVHSVHSSLPGRVLHVVLLFMGDAFVEPRGAEGLCARVGKPTDSKRRFQSGSAGYNCTSAMPLWLERRST